MVQRQQYQYIAVGCINTNPLTYLNAVGAQVLERQHHALGIARCSRCVNNYRCFIVGIIACNIFRFSNLRQFNFIKADKLRLILKLAASLYNGLFFAIAIVNHARTTVVEHVSHIVDRCCMVNRNNNLSVEPTCIKSENPL